MNKANGKTMHLSRTMGQDTGAENEQPQTPPPVPSPEKSASGLQQLGLAMVPFTPVGFTGQKSSYAYARLAIYAGLSYVTFRRYRQLSYIFGGAAAVSLATSLAGGAWNNGNGNNKNA